jgi:hypothetical protein
MLRTLSPIAAYVTRNSRDPERAAALCAWLETEVENLFTGKYHAYASPLDEFVVLAQIFYNDRKGGGAPRNPPPAALAVVRGS